MGSGWEEEAGSGSGLAEEEEVAGLDSAAAAERDWAVGWEAAEAAEWAASGLAAAEVVGRVAAEAAADRGWVAGWG